MQTLYLKELNLNIEEITKNNQKIKIIKFIGKIVNENAFELNKKFSDFFSDSIYNIILDLTELTYINSTGIAIIFSMFFKCKENQGKLIIGGLHTFTRKVFSIMTLPEGFTIYPTLQEAIEAF